MQIHLSSSKLFATFATIGGECRDPMSFLRFATIGGEANVFEEVRWIALESSWDLHSL